MIEIEVGKYYRFTYSKRMYVKYIYAKVIEIERGNLKLDGFSVPRDGRFYRFKEGSIPLLNCDRKSKEITKEEFESAVMLEML